MKADRYLKTLTKRIGSSRMRKEIMREYQAHIEDCKEALMESGMTEEAAEEEAVRQMGDPEEAGREMSRLYREILDLGIDLGLAYAYAENWCAGAGAMNNSGLILAIGVVILAHDMPQGVWITLALAAVQVLLRSYIQMLNQKRERELLWEVGVADTAVTYKGKGTFRGKQIKIKTREDEIQPGTPVMIVAMEGAKPVVARV